MANHRDHPRLRGEKAVTLLFLEIHVGSPPLTRGKAIDNYNREETHRITPAYAGKRWRRSSSGSKLRDHPRLRGEKQVERRFRVM